MIIKEVNLRNFRNYDSLKIKFCSSINIIYGNNAQGKTNLLESIYILSLTKSHRLNNGDNLVKFKRDTCKISGIIDFENIKKRYDITINKCGKQLKIDNQEIKKVNEYISASIDVILFYPEDLELIKGSPLARRNFLNIELSQLSKGYLKVLLDYNKVLKIRNDYLKKMNNKIKIDQSYFDIITDYLVDKGIKIYKMRKKFIMRINENCNEIYNTLTKDKNFYLKYNSNIDYDDINIKKILLEEYKNNLKKDIKVGTTLIGIHRDDIEFFLGDINLKEFGSQGQQRIAIISAKLAEIEIYKKYKGTTPILLLDDVFSELDDTKKNSLIKYIEHDMQVIITTTDLKSINKSKFKKANIFKIKNGNLIKLEKVDKNGK